VAVTRGIHRYDGRSAFTTWLFRVTTNAALDELRRRSRRPVPSEADPDHSGPVAAPGGPGSVESTVAARLDVDAALATLAPEFRAAVVLRDLCDLDYAEIAEALDIPIGTVRSRIARGRAALADRLGGEERAPAGEPGAGPERQTQKRP
jgi:RNA polymerase sigma-70 factor, ECF subfamily